MLELKKLAHFCSPELRWIRVPVLAPRRGNLAARYLEIVMISSGDNRACGPVAPGERRAYGDALGILLGFVGDTAVRKGQRGAIWLACRSPVGTSNCDGRAPFWSRVKRFSARSRRRVVLPKLPEGGRMRVESGRFTVRLAENEEDVAARAGAALRRLRRRDGRRRPSPEDAADRKARKRSFRSIL